MTFVPVDDMAWYRDPVVKRLPEIFSDRRLPGLHQRIADVRVLILILPLLVFVPAVSLWLPEPHSGSR